MPTRTTYMPLWTGCSSAKGLLRKNWRRVTSKTVDFGLYDLSSSYFEGEKCPLARLGYNRDGKKNKLQINYGL